MDKLTLIKRVCHATLLILFSIFIVLPAIVPASSVAESQDSAQDRLERRMRAQQRSAERLLQRLLRGEANQSDPETLAAARCASGSGAACVDENNTPISVTEVNDCDKCKGAPPNDCNTCCDNLSGGPGRRSRRCQDNNCA